MRTKRERIGHGLFAVAWVGGLAVAFRVALTAYDVNPEQLVGLFISTYLGAWGLLFFRSALGPAVDGARFAACTVSILLALTAIEVPVIFHLIDYRVVFSTPTPAWKRLGQRPDRDLLYVRDGHQRIRRTFEGNELGRLRGAVAWQAYRCDLRYDQQGFRNLGDRSTSDVIVLGDSFIEGLHVSDDELLTTRLSAALGRSVANLGRTGDGPQQELHVLRRYGLELRPRTCVWAFYEGNDLGDADRYEADQRHVAHALRERGAGRWYGRSFTRNSLAYVIRTWIHPEPRQPVARYTGSFVDRDGVKRPIYFGGDVRKEVPQWGASSSDLPGLRQFRSVLAEARELCRREQVEMVVVFIPTKFRVYRDLCRFEADSVCGAWPLDDLPDVLKRVVQDLPGSVEFLDLTTSLRREASRGSLLYLPDDTHWSAAGHQVAAEAIAECLDIRKPLPRTSIAESGEARDDARSPANRAMAAPTHHSP